MLTACGLLVANTVAAVFYVFCGILWTSCRRSLQTPRDDCARRCRVSRLPVLCGVVWGCGFGAPNFAESRCAIPQPSGKLKVSLCFNLPPPRPPNFNVGKVLLSEGVRSDFCFRGWPCTSTLNLGGAGGGWMNAA